VKYSQYYIPTFRENPSDADIVSQSIALRGGYIKKVATGIYDYLPLGLKVIRKIENIIREELNKRNAIEVLMPSMIPSELWEKSGRWYKYGKELLRIKDRANREFCYGPTHEEVIVDLLKDNLKSYKQLPINFYQIQNKFRDEIRPRFGLMRAREFFMKDAYSFHNSTECLDNTYKSMHEAYCCIFERCGLKYRVVSADSGAIGGNLSQEFMIVASSGEDEIIYCNNCDYSANIEKATTLINNEKKDFLPIEKVYTPDTKAIEDVANFLGIKKEQIIKAITYKYYTPTNSEEMNEKFLLVYIRGDYQVNETKLLNLINAVAIEPATEEEIVEIFNSVPGFIGIKEEQKNKYLVFYDDSIIGICNSVIGANELDYHYKNANQDRDFFIPSENIVDIKTVQENNLCPICKAGKLQKERGIEVGHIFKLGTVYSEKMKCVFLDEFGKEKNAIMGCYGIGVGRTAMAAIEQNYDDKGPIWPLSISPFHVIIIPVNPDNSDQFILANELYDELKKNNIDVLFDDRKERLGVKLNDADLIGSPYRVIIGKKAHERIIELSHRRNNDKQEMTITDFYDFIYNIKVNTQ
jgi:prolyl-tRNA synthetase